MGLPFTIAAGPRQRSHSQVRVPRDSWPHFTVSDSILSACKAMSPYLYPPGTWWLVYTLRHWVSFSSLPTTRRATVEVFEPAPFLYYHLARTEQKISFPKFLYSCLSIRFRGNLFIEPLVNNGRPLWFNYYSDLQASCPNIKRLIVKDAVYRPGFCFSSTD
jgi:hypothetical protein